MIAAEDLVAVAYRHLPAQRWFGHRDRSLRALTVIDQEVLHPGWPALVWTVLEAGFEAGLPSRFNVPLGLRPLGGDGERAVPAAASFGAVATERGLAAVSDATADPEVARLLLDHVLPDSGVTTVRALGVEQSNTSVVFDEAVILKVFRRVGDGPNPDAEVTEALTRRRFPHVAPLLARWHPGGVDRALVQPFLAHARDGWALALDSAAAGGDFSADAAALGRVTGRLHGELAEAFGRHPADPAAWRAAMVDQLAAIRSRLPEPTAGDRTMDALGSAGDAGAAIRVHGDYHLGQCMRQGGEWYVLDFEGEPARPLAQRVTPSSPLKDVAGMLRSFQYAAQMGGRHAGAASRPDEWEQRARDAFLAAYRRAVPAGLLPRSEADFRMVLTAFELDKACYEIAYEAAHRPDWIDVPMRAAARLIGAR